MLKSILMHVLVEEKVNLTRGMHSFRIPSTAISRIVEDICSLLWTCSLRRHTTAIQVSKMLLGEFFPHARTTTSLALIKSIHPRIRLQKRYLFLSKLFAEAINTNKQSIDVGQLQKIVNMAADSNNATYNTKKKITNSKADWRDVLNSLENDMPIRLSFGRALLLRLQYEKLKIVDNVFDGDGDDDDDDDDNDDDDDDTYPTALPTNNTTRRIVVSGRDSHRLIVARHHSQTPIIQRRNDLLILLLKVCLSYYGGSRLYSNGKLVGER